jgi:uncharacterized membrane protein (UPF0127 family)
MVSNVLIYSVILIYTFLLTSFDQKASRVCGLSLNGSRIKDARIIRVKSFVNKRVGLLNHSKLDALSGLWFCNTRKIHMKGMIIPIDLICLDKDGLIVQLVKGLQPQTGVHSGAGKTAHIFESGVGTIDQLSLKIGDRLTLC